MEAIRCEYATIGVKHNQMPSFPFFNVTIVLWLKFSKDLVSQAGVLCEQLQLKGHMTKQPADNENVLPDQLHYAKCGIVT